jgi:hypothetical protein
MPAGLIAGVLALARGELYALAGLKVLADSGHPSGELVSQVPSFARNRILCCIHLRSSTPSGHPSLVPPLALLGLGLVGFVSLVLVLALLTTVLALLALFRNAKT